MAIMFFLLALSMRLAFLEKATNLYQTSSRAYIGLKHVVFRLGFKYVWKMHVFSPNM